MPRFPIRPDVIIKEKKYRRDCDGLISMRKKMINTELKIETYPFSPLLHTMLKNEPRFGKLYHAHLGDTKYRILYCVAEEKNKVILTYIEIGSHR